MFNKFFEKRPNEDYYDHYVRTHKWDQRIQNIIGFSMFFGFQIIGIIGCLIAMYYTCK